MRYNDINYEGLRKAIEHSRRRLQPYREKRVAAVREFVGRNYSDTGSRDRVPVNMLELFVSTYSRQLIANRPQVNVTPRVRSLAPQASELGLATNHVLKEMDIETTLRLAVIDGLFSIGIVKVGVTEPQYEPMRGFLHESGQPFAECVGLDDWVHDMSARSMEECGYMGHRYRVPTRLLKESDLFSNNADVPTITKSLYNESGDIRAEAIGQSDIYHGGFDEEYSELWEIWLPDVGRIVTFVAGENGMPSKKVREVDWDGPETGPYHFLKFTDVPGNTMPLPPVATLVDMHDLANRVFRKLGRQAERQKDVVGYRGSAEQDAKNVQTSADGEVIRMDDPQNISTYKFGGIDDKNLAFLLQVKNLFNYYGGNIDSLGGLGPQSGTAKQDQLISESASRRMADFQESTKTFAKSVCSAVSHFIFHDESSMLELEKSLPNADLKVPFVYSKDRKDADFFDFNFDIEPHSMASQSPGEKMQSLRELVNTFIGPLLPSLQQQGISIDGREIIRLASDLSQLPELKNIFTGIDPVQAAETPQPQNRQTEIIRTNRPGATPRGQDDAMARMMMSGDGPGVQPSEAAAVQRPVG